MFPDPARTLSNAEFWRYIALRDAYGYDVTARILGVTVEELRLSVLEGLAPERLAVLRDRLDKQEIRK